MSRERWQDGWVVSSWQWVVVYPCFTDDGSADKLRSLTTWSSPSTSACVCSAFQWPSLVSSETSEIDK